MNARAVALFLLTLVFCLPVYADVRLSILVINGKHRDVIKEITDGFEDKHPSIKVLVNGRGNAAYNDYMMAMDWIEDADVVWYFGGYRLKAHAENGLIEQIDDVWKREGLYDSLRTTRDLVSVGEHVYGIPVSFYQWGIYYKKSVFDKFNLNEPRTWEDFEKVCETLKRNGVIPIVLGINEPRKWTAAAWFSYLNLRINGLDFHTKLLDGGISFLDIRVKRVFEKIKLLLDRGYFNENLAEIDSRGIYPYLYRGLAAMTLTGKFAFNDLQPSYYEKIGFFRFPTVDNSIPLYEETPTDVLFINKASRRKDEAKKLIEYWATAQVLNKYNNALGFISPNISSTQGQTDFADAEKKALKDASGFSQYFNRDTSALMAEHALNVLGNFMIYPDIEKTMEELDKYSKAYLRSNLIE